MLKTQSTNRYRELEERTFSFAKRCCLWLNLTEPADSDKEEQRLLIKEAEELRKIFSSILDKSS